MAKARLRDRHQKNLKRKLELLKAEQGFDDSEAQSTSESMPTAVKEEPNEEIVEQEEEAPEAR